jgi:multiple sugar transport system permease protein
MLMFLAALQDIPTEVEEAAMVDGAGRWQRFRYVTLPMLTPVIFFTLVIGIIDGFQYFDQAYVSATTAGPGPGFPENSLLFYSVWLYEQAFTFSHMGYAAAMAWIMFVATMVMTAILLLTSRRWVHYGGSLS